jgi:DNA-binding response OmpR family regulator
MPDLDGFGVLEQLRAGEPTGGPRVVILSCRADEAAQVRSWELGADDYLVKPFSPRELVARVRAVLRRVDEHDTTPDDEPIVRGDLTVDPARRRVTVAGRPAELTPTEFDLLAHLARQPGRVFTRAQLLTALHGVAVESYERAVDAHVKNLRRKIEPDPRHPRYVLTAHGIGYRFTDDGA